jgi:methylenetetrahydrofolate reductase (NADPH)
LKISDILKSGQRTVSFEFFPPKDDLGFWDLYKTIEQLKPLSPTFVSVTYGAGGSTRRKTVELVKRIRMDIGIEAMAHLTCVGATREEIQGVLDELAAAGLENVLALRGDPPQGATEFVPTPGGFAHADELAGFIRGRYSFCIGGACYPEKHPEAPDFEADLRNLKRKVEAGAEFLITQLFFDNADFYRFRERAAALRIRVPIVAGIMPILGVAQVKRFTGMCGARIPSALLARMEAVEADPAAVRAIGVEHAARQCEDLLANGVAGIHFYTLNRSHATREIFSHIRGAFGERMGV